MKVGADFPEDGCDEPAHREIDESPRRPETVDARGAQCDPARRYHPFKSKQDPALRASEEADRIGAVCPRDEDVYG